MRARPATALTASAAAALLLLVATPDPEALAARLGARTAAERDAAETELARLGDAAAPALEGAARSPDAEIRARAGALLRRLRDDDAARSERRAQQARDLLRDAAGDPSALTADGDLDARLRDLDPEAGAVLAELALGVARDELVGAPLAIALTRRATPAALAALARLWRDDRLPPSAALAAAWDLDARTAADRTLEPAVRDAAQAAAAALGDVLAADEPYRRRTGVALLAALSGGAAAATLLRAARDGDAAVRGEAARALGRHLPRGAADALRALAADDDASVRAAALAALRRVPGAPRPEPAVAAAADDVPAVRRAAAELLAGDATPETLPALHALARDPALSVRAAAYRSLARLGAR